MMKVFVLALLVVAYTAADPNLSDPQSAANAIKDAAYEEASSVEAETAKLNDQVEHTKQQLQVNAEFAKGVSKEVVETTKAFDHIEQNELASIKDAAEIKTDAESGAETVLDIESTDEDAQRLSTQIDQEARDADTQLLHEIQELEDAGVGKHHEKKSDEAELGESKEDWLAQAEQQAESKVQDAKDGKKAMESTLAEEKSKLTDLSKMAAEGLTTLKSSESRLHQDINGHKDVALEKDMEEKARDIEKLQKHQEAPAAAAEEMQEEVSTAPVEQSSEEPNFFNIAGDTDNKELGESKMSLKEVEAAAEAASMQAKEAPQPAPSSYEAAPEESSGIAADLSAIESDAQQLEDYQQATIKEVEMISKPLQ